MKENTSFMQEPKLPRLETKVKGILSKSHAEIIRGAWNGLGEEGQRLINSSILEALKGIHPGEEKIRYSEIVKAAWSLGFDYAMYAVEQGVLIKAGPIRPEEN